MLNFIINYYKILYNFYSNKKYNEVKFNDNEKIIVYTKLL